VCSSDLLRKSFVITEIDAGVSTKRVFKRLPASVLVAM